MNSTNRQISIVTPIALSGFLVIMIIIYGLLTQFYREMVLAFDSSGNRADVQNPDRAVWNTCLLIMDSVFTLLGFGLLLSVFKNQKWSGMTIALFVVSFNVIFGLLIQKLMFQIFFGFRKTLDSSDSGYVNGPNAYQFWNRQSWTGKAQSSYFSFRLSNLCSTAYLVGMTAFNGRVTFSNIVYSLPLFSILYYLNLYINAVVCYSTRSKDASFVYLDAYGTILVYLFGGVYGFVTAFLNKSPIQNAQQADRIRKSRVSMHLSLLGSFFIFATFCLSHTGIVSGVYKSSAQSFRFNSRAILVMFGLTSGVIGNFVVSIFIGKGRINIQGIIISIFTGGIMVGGICDVIQNIGATLFLGFAAGAIAAIFTNIVTPKINQKQITDSQGLLGPILVVSFIACFVVHPSVIAGLYNSSSKITPRALGYAQTDPKVARYHLIYFVITLAFSLITGVVMGLIYKIKRLAHKDFLDIKFFNDDYGLYDPSYVPPVKYEAPPQPSAVNLQTQPHIVPM